MVDVARVDEDVDVAVVLLQRSDDRPEYALTSSAGVAVRMEDPHGDLVRVVPVLGILPSRQEYPYEDEDHQRIEREGKEPAGRHERRDLNAPEDEPLHKHLRRVFHTQAH